MPDTVRVLRYRGFAAELAAEARGEPVWYPPAVARIPPPVSGGARMRYPSHLCYAGDHDRCGFVSCPCWCHDAEWPDV
jgi:hypothetical protein